MNAIEPIPSTMRAALLIGRGGPEMLQVRDDVPVPVPEPGQALLKVAACGMNNTDINTRVGWYSRNVDVGTTGQELDEVDAEDATWGRRSLTFPRIQGADPSGTIVAVGDGVDDGLLGRRVLVDGWIRDPANPSDRDLAGYLGSEIDGGYAEYCVVPAVNVHPHSSDLPDATLAALPCSWSTAEHMLQRVRLSDGQTAVITGAAGGVGSALVALAKLRGARVVAICGAAKRDRVAALGADAVLARDAGEIPAAAAEAAGGPIDVVADVVGGPDVAGWFEALRRGGRYVTAGAIAGPIVPLDLRTLYLNDLELYGATIYEPGVFADLIGYLDRGEITPVVDAVYPLADIAAAQAAFERKHHVGAIVVDLHP
ncbi:MAG: zinc-binding dehydrogenase [Actinomycetota bacterium]